MPEIIIRTKDNKSSKVFYDGKEIGMLEDVGDIYDNVADVIRRLIKIVNPMLSKDYNKIIITQQFE